MEPGDGNTEKPPQTVVTPAPDPGAGSDVPMLSLFWAEKEFSSRDFSGGGFGPGGPGGPGDSGGPGGSGPQFPGGNR